MRILGIDTETTGFCPDKDRITEIGAVVWDTEKRAPLSMTNVNLLCPEVTEITSDITRITGIDMAHLKEFGRTDITEVLFNLGKQMAHVGICVAHNAPFDRGMLQAAFTRAELLFPEVVWIDTSVDLPFHAGVKSRSLNYVSADYKINPNPFAHRALFDVMQMLQLLDKFDFTAVLARANEPNVTLVATTRPPWQDPSPEGSKDNDRAKAAGFRWAGDIKRWTRVVKSSEVRAITDSLPFPIGVMK
jgi:DNA polymerase III alpha subunit (gram-positive type)